MTTPTDDGPNPYQAPASDLAPPPDVPEGPGVPDAIRKRFREQIVALGVVWVLLGGLMAVGGAIVLRRFAQGAGGAVVILQPAGFEANVPILIAGFVALGVVWMVAGVLAVMKQLGAVYVGLIVTYLALLTQVVTLNLCTLVLVALVVIQAHRVIGWGRQLRDAGVPLNARP